MKYVQSIPGMALALIMLVFAQPSMAASQQKLQQYDYPNGVRLIVEEDHSAPDAMVQVWLKVGGRDEVPGKTGLAHVFEHMMFKGSKKLKPGEYSRKIAAMGGNDNAFTTTDYTAYFETVPSSRVDEVVGMECERFANLALDPKEFGREIRVIQEERRMRTEDDPNNHMYEELAAAALRLHPYRNPVIGWMQDLKRLDIQDVRAFYKAHYVPGNATVVVVGDVDFEHLKKTVGKSFGALKARPVPERFNPVEPEPLGPKRVVVKLPAQSPVVTVVMPVPVWKPGENDREAAALAVATQILAGGRSALLQRELVDRQKKAFSVWAGYDPFSMGIDLWAVSGDLGKKQKPADFEAALWKLIGGLAAKPVDAETLAAAKTNMIANETYAQDSLYLRAKEIGRMEVAGVGAMHRDDWLRAIRAVTAGDVQKVVGRWLKVDRSTTGILEPTNMPGAEVKS